jgi:hypothetical protein
VRESGDRTRCAKATRKPDKSAQIIFNRTGPRALAARWSRPKGVGSWLMPPVRGRKLQRERAQARTYTIGVYDRRKDYNKWRTRAASRRAPAPLARGRSVRSRAHRSRAVLERVIYRKATETRTDSLAPAVSSRAAEC